MYAKDQIAAFRQAVALLGGVAAAARALNMTDRNVRHYGAGRHAIPPGVLRDLAALLATHADRARALEKRLNPLFSANLTPAQARKEGLR